MFRQTVLVVGSSPLARGTPPGRVPLRHFDRFIPAGAGNTKTKPAQGGLRTVHPRWRGEHTNRLELEAGYRGSSPLARGTRRQPRRSRPTRTVHPRWRGEHDQVKLGAALDIGSSPLARGTQNELRQIITDARFIPAGAGNTVLPQPREAVAGGSSPLARGTRRARATRTRQVRFIPAGAGNTGTRRASWRCVPVHPRWRGEHSA